MIFLFFFFKYLPTRGATAARRRYHQCWLFRDTCIFLFRKTNIYRVHVYDACFSTYTNTTTRLHTNWWIEIVEHVLFSPDYKSGAYEQASFSFLTIRSVSHFIAWLRWGGGGTGVAPRRFSTLIKSSFHEQYKRFEER